MATANQNNRQLNVKDALCYLDDVKNQFKDQPEVYNRFLEIMKDFKSQSIDTPGVIERVSTLFCGYKELILGFNTFLPPGYRIEPSNDSAQGIRVITPSTDTTGAGNVALERGAAADGAAAGAEYYNGAGSAPRPPVFGLPAPSAANSRIPPPAAPLPTPGHGAPKAEAPMDDGSAAGGDDRARQPVEFNHAISYVNKIKNRYANEPETYKQFLEILQTYQKDQKPIQEVYAQVRVLFNGAPDLLDEFKQFLPDTSANAAAAGAAAGGPASILGGGAGRGAVPGGMYTGATTRLPYSGYGGAGRTAAAAASSATQKTGRGGSKGLRGAQTGNNGALAYGNVYGAALHPFQGAPNGGMPMTTPMANAGLAAPQLAPMAQQPAPPPPRRRKAAVSAAQLARDRQITEELDFFEKVRRSINHKATYTEFLKILNLFSQGIIDATALVDRAAPFLGRNPELLEWLKKFVRYEEAPIVYNVPAPIQAVDIRTCRRSGHSYRLLPPEVKQPPSSNRDTLCREVLNDTWISHPVFASEDSGFLTHRKNQYEEALHKVEEERFEFDTNIEANLHTIALLEPIAQRLLQMTPDEQASFQLPPGLGGTSTTIYQRIIRKIYDKERGVEIVSALHSCPAVAVPIVLRRLKQKDEEWKRAQREWNKVWRDVERKNFYKALDYQSANFKANDKKMLTVKMFVQEIEQLYLEQEHRRLMASAGGAAGASAAAAAPRYQFDFVFKDVEVFKDVNNLLFFYSQYGSGINSSDSARVAEFLKGFLARFFFLEDVYAEHATAEQTQRLFQGATLKPAAEPESQTGSQSASQTASQKASTSGSADASDDGRMVDSDEDDNDGNDGKDVKGEEIASVEAPAPPSKPLRPSYVFYANNILYAFVRMYQVMYARLAKMKELAEAIAADPPHQMRQNETAVAHGMQDAAGTPPNAHAYEVLIKTICRFYRGRLDHSQFEERVRALFGGSAYLMFTVDKTALAVIKQIAAVMADPRCVELMAQYEADRGKESSSARQEAMYRLAAETALPDENLYRLELFPAEKVLTMQLLGKGDFLTESNISPEERWSLYVDHFLQLQSVEGVRLRRREPFLKRSLPREMSDDLLANIVSRSGLELKICVNTYKLFFLEGTEDSFFRLRPNADSAGDSLRARREARHRNGTFEKWLSETLTSRRRQPGGAAPLDLDELEQRGEAVMNGDAVDGGDDGDDSGNVAALGLYDAQFKLDISTRVVGERACRVFRMVR